MTSMRKRLYHGKRAIIRMSVVAVETAVECGKNAWQSMQKTCGGSSRECHEGTLKKQLLCSEEAVDEVNEEGKV